MKLFSIIHDLFLTAHFKKAAKKINAKITSIAPIMENYESDKKISNSEMKLLNSTLNVIENNLNYLQRKMQNVASDCRFNYVVPCIGGHFTPIPFYIMDISLIIRLLNINEKCDANTENIAIEKIQVVVRQINLDFLYCNILCICITFLINI